MKRKNLFISFAMSLSIVFLTAFSSTTNATANESKLAECCEVTIYNPETNESAKVRKCATLFADACRLAVEAAISSLED